MRTVVMATTTERWASVEGRSCPEDLGRAVVPEAFLGLWIPWWVRRVLPWEQARAPKLEVQNLPRKWPRHWKKNRKQESDLEVFEG